MNHMNKPANAEYIREILDKTDHMGYMQIKGDTKEERQKDLLKQFKEKLEKYHNDHREDYYQRS